MTGRRIKIGFPLLFLIGLLLGKIEDAHAHKTLSRGNVKQPHAEILFENEDLPFATIPSEASPESARLQIKSPHKGRVIWDQSSHDASKAELNGLNLANFPERFRRIAEEQWSRHSVSIQSELLRLGRKVTRLEEYLQDLCLDPAHNLNPERISKGVLEAIIGLDAIDKGKIPGPIVRGPAEIEFYDLTTRLPWDIKSPMPDRWKSGNLGNSVRSITQQLSRITSTLEDSEHRSHVTHVGVIVNVGFLTDEQRQDLEGSLDETMDHEHVGHYVEVDTSIFQKP